MPFHKLGQMGGNRYTKEGQYVPTMAELRQSSGYRRLTEPLDPFNPVPKFGERPQVTKIGPWDSWLETMSKRLLDRRFWGFADPAKEYDRKVREWQFRQLWDPDVPDPWPRFPGGPIYKSPPKKLPTPGEIMVNGQPYYPGGKPDLPGGWINPINWFREE